MAGVIIWETLWLIKLCHTMRFGSTAKVLAKCMPKYYRISECVPAGLQAVRIANHPQQHTIQNVLVDMCGAEGVVIADERRAARSMLDGYQGLIRNTYTRDGRRMYKKGNTITEIPEPRSVTPRLKRCTS